MALALGKRRHFTVVYSNAKSKPKRINNILVQRSSNKLKYSQYTLVINVKIRMS